MIGRKLRRIAKRSTSSVVTTAVRERWLSAICLASSRARTAGVRRGAMCAYFFVSAMVLFGPLDCWRLTAAASFV